jgi:DOPA 4,5-dioxygenase
MADRPIGPHPMPQFEIHFPERSAVAVAATIEATGLKALIHPLTNDDVADHTILARWIGEKLALDITVLDPPGTNQGMPRFGRADF